MWWVFMIRVGRISYLNTEPFFFKWQGGSSFKFTEGHPRELFLAAKEGLIDCAPLPLVGCWTLEKDFEPLGSWGIAIHREAGSVVLFSKKGLRDLESCTIGVTEETSTSAVLLDVVLRAGYGVRTVLKRGFSQSDDAQLFIGDSALLHRENGLMGYPFAYDLGREWVQWQKCPFVFAQWVVRRSLAEEAKRSLSEALASSLRKGLESLDEIASLWSSRLSLPPLSLRRYLDGFSYELGDAEREAMLVFKGMMEDAKVL